MHRGGKKKKNRSFTKFPFPCSRSNLEKFGIKRGREGGGCRRQSFELQERNYFSLRRVVIIADNLFQNNEERNYQRLDTRLRKNTNLFLEAIPLHDRHTTSRDTTKAHRPRLIPCIGVVQARVWSDEPSLR